MPLTTICPTEELLVAYGLGKVSDAELDLLAAHIEHCPACQERAASASGDSFVERLRIARKQTAILLDSASEPVRLTFPGVPASDLPPELANHPDYENVRELGRGGMGVVYLAQHRLMKRPEVLKVMCQAQTVRKGATDRFLQEMQSAARLNHPNVVKAYSATRLGDIIAFSMEYVPGDDLAQVVKAGGPLSVRRASFYVAQVARGLQHAHEMGMVHRDIKPANLILTRTGTRRVVKILDFGLAKVTSERAQDTGLTGDGQMIGTPDYMAPEQSADAAKADIRADIYSLGCTLYYLLAGHTPFRGTSLVDLLLKHLSVTPRAIDLDRPDVPPGLAAVVAKMLAKDPGRRFQTPGEVAAVLEPFFAPAKKRPADLAEQPTETEADSKPAEPDVADRSSMTVPGTTTQPPSGGDSATEPVLRRPRWLWPSVAAGVLALALLGGSAGGVFAVRTEGGTIEFVDLAESADVRVDGEKVTVVRDSGRQKAEVRVEPGSHKLEVRQNGVAVVGETVEVEPNGRTLVSAKPRAEPKPDQKIPGPKTEPKAAVQPVAKASVKPAPPALSGQFVPLFNGKDLTGWEQLGNEAANWKVVNGILVGSWPSGADGAGGSSLRWSQPTMRHFHLRLRLMPAENSSTKLYLSSTVRTKNPHSGSLGVVLGTADGQDSESTGRVTGAESSRALAPVKLTAKKWFDLDVVVQGNRITVDVDGKRTADLESSTTHSRTPNINLGLASHGVMRFKSIEIKELPAPAK